MDLFSSTASNVNRTKASASLCRVCSSLARQGNPSYRNATDADDPPFFYSDNRNMVLQVNNKKGL